MEPREYSLAETFDLATELRARWERQGVSFRAPATHVEIAAFERAHSLRLPGEVRAYLVVVNGMTDLESDDDLLEFLSLDRMTEELERHPTEPRSVVLVDYCLSGFVYGIHASLEPAPTAPIYSIGELAERQVFSSFTELLRVHLHEKDGIVGR